MNFPPYPPLTSLVFASTAMDLGHEQSGQMARTVITFQRANPGGGSFSRTVPENNQTVQLLRGWLVVMTNHPRTKCWTCVWNVEHPINRVIADKPWSVIALSAIYQPPTV